MKKAPDLTGLLFGRLAVLGFHSRDGKNTWWRCLCKCGTEKVCSRTGLTCGDNKSCGCLKTEWMKFKLRHSSITHGMSHTPEHRAWRNLKDRCFNRNNGSFDRYGGRGIRVCERWMKFKNFYADMGNRPSELHSIERRNNDGDYSPENCYWGTTRQQSRNRRNTIKVHWQGEERILIDLCEELGFEYGTAYERIAKWGWPVEAALSKTRQNYWVRKNPRHRMIEFRGRIQPLGKWAKEMGIHHSLLAYRLDKGWPIELAMTKPVSRTGPKTIKRGSQSAGV